MRKLTCVVASCCLCLITFIPAFSQSNKARRPPKTSPISEDEYRVDEILVQMTLEEKIDLLGGVDGFYVRGVPRLKVPRLKMADGPIGVRNYGPATTVAGGISLAATWNPALAQRVGTEIGRDARARGVHFLLGPGVNIYRSPLNGRNFEYYGEDPFLASQVTVGYIKGVQSQGVSATIKHFMGNNSEFDRHGTNSIIDERTMREIYLPTFEAAVKEAHVGAIMDSYNLTNGSHMTQNGYLNTDVAKREWGFDGIMMSDWVATYDALGAANQGLDLEMPFGMFLNRNTLLPAIKQGKVSIATIDDKVRRILRTAVRFGWLDREQTDLNISRNNLQGHRVALESAREGMVLLKNDGNLLPLDREKIKSIAIIGPNAYPAVPVGGGSAQVQPFAAVSFLEGLTNTLGAKSLVTYNRGIPTLDELAAATNFTTEPKNGVAGLKVEDFANIDLSGTPAATHLDRRVNLEGYFGDFETPKGPSSTRWSGYYSAETAGQYNMFIQTGWEGGGARLILDDKLVIDDWQITKELVSQISVPLTQGLHKVVLEQYRRKGFGAPRLRLGIARQDAIVDVEAKSLASKADVVVLAVGFAPDTESEGGDRTFQLPPGQEELIREIAAVNRNTVVVVTSGGSFDAANWLDRVRSVVEAWYPGQEGGTALAEVLVGDVNPSGRLPVTFEQRAEDNPAYGHYYPEKGTNLILYKEGVFVGYRGYDQKGTKPLFPFGYGLSYTTFAYSNMVIKPVGAEGALAGYEVSFDVKNTGSRAGAEVAQLYVGDKHSKVARPAKELKGFAKVNLLPGETKRVTINLDLRAFSYWDTESKDWRIDPGDFEIMVGRSSSQIELKGKATM